MTADVIVLFCIGCAIAAAAIGGIIVGKKHGGGEWYNRTSGGNIPSGPLTF